MAGRIGSDAKATSFLRRSRNVPLSLALAAVVSALVAAAVLGLTVAAADQVALGGAGDGPGQSATALEPGSGEPGGGSAGSKIERRYGTLPLSFEPTGAGEPADFLAQGSGYAAFLHDGDATLSLARPAANRRGESATTGEGLALRIGLVGANPAEPEAVRRLPGEVNYLNGKDPRGWRTEVPTFERVRYAHAWPGIDVVYYGNQGRLEYDFALAPGVDPERIALRFAGQDGVGVAPNGDLVLSSQGHSLRQAAPVAYQQVGGERRSVESAYAIRDDGTVGFDIGRHDRGRALVIDPVILTYSTFLGGSSNETGNNIAVDSAGAAYVTGNTHSTAFPPHFPTTAGAFDTTLDGSHDAFVTKLNPAGTALEYSTFLGGASSDLAFGVAVDSAGAAYVTGRAESTDFPTTAGAFDTTHAGGNDPNGDFDAFVTKLNPAGAALEYSTFLGGAGFDQGNAIAVDSAGAAYLTGETSSTGFPTTTGAFDTSEYMGSYDAFVTKFSLDPPSVSISDVTQAEGDSATTSFDFTVSLSEPAPVGGVTVYYATADGTATQPSDYGQASGTVTFAEGDDEETITVLVNGDADFEPDETFTVDLGPSFGGYITDSHGEATIVNDDAQPPQLAASPGSLAFPDTPVGSTSAPQTVTVTNPGGGQLNVSAVAITGTDASDFLISSDTCTGAAIGPSDDCEVSVSFTPTAPGARSAGLQISSDAASSPDTVPLSGAGEALRCGGLEVTIYGTDGADTIDGTAGRDVIHALGGDDTITPRAKKDTVCAGTGEDTAHSGDGNDLIRGGADDDRLFGNADDDVLLGQAGDDELHGGSGANDVCNGGGGADTAAASCERTPRAP